MQIPAQNPGDVVIRLPEVCRQTGLSRSTIYAYIGKNKPDNVVFPYGIRLGAQCSGWLQREISAWIAAKVEQRDAEVRHG